MGEKWGYPNIQIDPNRSRSNQIKSNRPWVYPNQIKLKVQFDLIYLFASLVVALLRKHKDSKILCLNRSNNGKQRTMSALQQADDSSLGHADRLHFLAADITKPNLGFDDLLCETFVSEVDEVIFNAWNPNWGIPLESFEPLLGAVRSAVDICADSPRRPRLLFMSSTCAIADWPQFHPDRPLVPEEPAWDDASATDDGYGLSKCKAEQLTYLPKPMLALASASLLRGPAKSEAHHPRTLDRKAGQSRDRCT